MLDSDLAEIFGVETRVLIQAVKRNIKRFPSNFMFQLTKEEFSFLRSQTVTSKGSGGRRYAPYAFTEHGSVMLATILNSPSAVQASVYIVDAFVRLRHAVDSGKQINKKLEELGTKVSFHDEAIAVLFDEIKKLAMPDEPESKGKIGFKHAGKK
jgi:phage regulator Rha-like protein